MQQQAKYRAIASYTITYDYHVSFTRAVFSSQQFNPIKNYRGLSPNYREERWAYVHLMRGAANHPIIYLRSTFGLHHEANKCAYLRILISEAPTNKKYEWKMHIEVSKTDFLNSFQ